MSILASGATMRPKSDTKRRSVSLSGSVTIDKRGRGAAAAGTRGAVGCARTRGVAGGAGGAGTSSRSATDSA
jgi:hypothetical protein